jgi:hypothetical protein
LVNVLADDFPSTTGCMFPKLGQLHLGVLSVGRRDTGIQCDPHADARFPALRDMFTDDFVTL